MAEAVEARLGQTPSRLLADTNYATAGDIEALGGRPENPIAVYAPPQPMKKDTKPENLARRKAKLAKEPDAIKDWRQRMETPEAAEMMKKRKRSNSSTPKPRIAVSITFPSGAWSKPRPSRFGMRSRITS